MGACGRSLFHLPGNITKPKASPEQIKGSIQIIFTSCRKTTSYDSSPSLPSPNNRLHPETGLLGNTEEAFSKPWSLVGEETLLILLRMLILPRSHTTNTCCGVSKAKSIQRIELSSTHCFRNLRTRKQILLNPKHRKLNFPWGCSSAVEGSCKMHVALDSISCTNRGRNKFPSQ